MSGNSERIRILDSPKDKRNKTIVLEKERLLVILNSCWFLK